MTCEAVPLTEEAVRYLDPAMKRGGNDWYDAQRWLAEGSAQVWKINDAAYVLAVANVENELEILAAGGVNARDAVKPWEAHLRSDPRLKGFTALVKGRRGWKRHLPHWECEELPDGDVILRTGI